MCGLRYQYLISREGGGEGRGKALVPHGGELVAYVRFKVPVPV